MQSKSDSLKEIISDLALVLDATRQNRLVETTKLLERALEVSKIEVSARQ